MDDQEHAEIADDAVTAFIKAGEMMGVSPVKLARWLGTDRNLGDLLQILSIVAQVPGQHRAATVRLLREYLSLLDEELPGAR